MWRELGEVAQISTGYPFRGKVEHVPGGPLVVLQQKDISVMVAMPDPSTFRIYPWKAGYQTVAAMF